MYSRQCNFRRQLARATAGANPSWGPGHLWSSAALALVLGAQYRLPKCRKALARWRPDRNLFHRKQRRTLDNHLTNFTSVSYINTTLSFRGAVPACLPLN